MADVNVKTSPTPIQRNKLDVAMELTELHSRLGGFRQSGHQALQQTFAEYYALVSLCEGASYEELEGLVSDEIRSKFTGTRPLY
jgi:hypothetical protein